MLDVVAIDSALFEDHLQLILILSDAALRVTPVDIRISLARNW